MNDDELAACWLGYLHDTAILMSGRPSPAVPLSISPHASASRLL